MQLKKTLTCLALASVCTIAVAQSDSSSAEWQYAPPTTIFGVYDPLNVQLSENRFAFTAYGDLYAASNCFSASFLQNFFGSGFITEEMKDFAADKLKAENRIGVDVSTGLWMQMASKKNADNILLAGIHYNFQEGSNFTPDLFHLAFYGNYDYQNVEAQLTGSTFSLTNVMEYKIGFMKLLNDDYNKFKLGGTIGLVQGISGLDIKARYATLYTAEDGRYIDLNYDFNIYTSGKGAPNLAQFAGAGASADIFWQGYFTDPDITINAMVNDLGVVFWNNDPLKITGDSIVRFEGIELDNFFSATDEAVTGSSDSLLEILGVVEETEKTFTQALPTRINLSASKGFGESIYLTVGGQYILNTPYTPVVFMQLAKVFAPLGMSIGVNAHSGGYGMFNAGLDIAKSFGSHIDLRLGSNSLLGVVAQDSFRGLGAYGALTVKL